MVITAEIEASKLNQGPSLMAHQKTNKKSLRRTEPASDDTDIKPKLWMPWQPKQTEKGTDSLGATADIWRVTKSLSLKHQFTLVTQSLLDHIEVKDPMHS